MIITWPGKLLALLIALAVAFGAGYYCSSRRAPVAQIVTVDHEVKVKGDTVIQWKDRIVTVTVVKAPDGTTTSTTTTEEKQKDEQQHSSTESKQVATTPVPGPISSGAEYSLGVSYRPALGSDLSVPDWHSVQISLGRKVVGPLWAEVGVSGRRELSFGLRLEF